MSPFSINFSKVYGDGEDQILMTFEARSELHSSEQVAEVNPQFMNTQEIIQQQKERKKEQELLRQKSEELKKEKEKIAALENQKSATAASKDYNIKIDNTNSNNNSYNNTMNEDFLKQNMDFFKTVRTDINDHRLIDMQRENDALKEHNQTLVAQLAEKDSLVKMYLSKIESLSDQFSRLESKIQSTQISMQQNLTPYQDRAAMMHPNNTDDHIDSSNVQYASQVLVLKDSM